MVNLNRFKKRKAKQEKERRAETNRRLHGRTKAEREAEASRKEKEQKDLAGKFLLPERVSLEALVQSELKEKPAAHAVSNQAEKQFEALEAATKKVLSISEYSEELKRHARDSEALGNDHLEGDD
ncbi:MAG: DUF4169 family protein [Polyangiaceae bacterium]|nr:DUF4169 family protein [Polyangiaceae bacterium]